ncbi:MAG: hypothetical protein P1S46_10355 [bacterium]|nr:hypothetical protein [bacterium]MDT8395983.1 hypothetical protein [bacterium]
MRRNRLIITILPAIILFTVVSGTASADDGTGWKLVDGVVATVDGAPVLRSDIHMEVDFGLLKVNGSGDSFEDLLELYLNRMLILREVEEMGGYRLNSGEAEDAYRDYLGQYSGSTSYSEKLQRWDVDEGEIFRRLKNALLTTRYTESRLQFLVNVLPSDIENAYRKDPERWGGKDLYDSWEAIKADLTGETFAVEKTRWIDTLRERYKLILLDRSGGSGR